MLTNRHKQSGTRGAGHTAPTWPCLPKTGRGRVVVAAGGVCPSESAVAYLFGGEPGLMGAISIENPRFADRRVGRNQNQI
jgi:hypothetical protein